MEHDVFISYSRHDMVVANATCAALEAAGVRCWIAPRDVIPGTEFAESIIIAIEDCRAMVLIFSGKSNESTHVKKEVDRAVSKGKNIISFRIADIPPSKSLEYYLSGYHWLDARTPPLELRIDELVATVGELLGKGPRWQRATPAVEPKSPGSGTKVVRIPTKGVLFVACNPDRARITVDGKAESPRCVMDLGPGGSRTVLVEVSCPGFETAAYRATLVAGEDVCIDAALDFSLASPGTKIGDTVVNPIDGTEFVWVPGGNFTMGTDSIPADLGGFFPKAHPVALGGFWIAKNDVTWGQYKEFCAETKRSWPDAPSWGIQEDHPVVNVSYEDAANYAKWAGCQLPTEEQWEKAARGTDGREYPWGNDWDASKCRFNADSTSPVGSFPNGASPYGCLDMVGNVCVWTSSIYKPGQNYRVIRGGSWRAASPVIMRCACRSGSDPSYRYYGLGFRIAGPVLP